MRLILFVLMLLFFSCQKDDSVVRVNENYDEVISEGVSDRDSDRVGTKSGSFPIKPSGDNITINTDTCSQIIGMNAGIHIPWLFDKFIPYEKIHHVLWYGDVNSRRGMIYVIFAHDGEALGYNEYPRVEYVLPSCTPCEARAWYDYVFIPYFDINGYSSVDFRAEGYEYFK
jgi:hypothetical protein